ncbi:MAG: hypothetical protein D6679_03135 [Candidatus Hydrogenedentota bacterium]|nr:MAG: hypothetical protein D6679_03135 [Candidatus Hydrogenedentota bacterium]
MPPRKHFDPVPLIPVSSRGKGNGKERGMGKGKEKGDGKRFLAAQACPQEDPQGAPFRGAQASCLQE